MHEQILNCIKKTIEIYGLNFDHFRYYIEIKNDELELILPKTNYGGFNCSSINRDIFNSLNNYIDLNTKHMTYDYHLSNMGHYEVMEEVSIITFH